MGKAITGAEELAGVVGFGALAAFIPALAPLYFAALPGMLAGAASSFVGAIADALTSNRGMDQTIRQPAAFRQIVYGTQRVGGVIIYRSTTGSHKNQANFVIVLASHELYAIENIYIDGRQVHFKGSGVGWQVRNGYGFGGYPDGGDHIGPDGAVYNFSSTDLYVEARYGDQPVTDYNTGLQANDPTWGPDAQGNVPSVAGCAYLYVKFEYNPTNFPQTPEIRVTVHGKPVLDPRTGEMVASQNPALIVNDILTDPNYGLGDNTVNQDQLIAAANICDEMMPCAGGSEYQYTCNWHYDTSMAPGDALKTVLASCGGRISRIGGEWFIWPAAFTGPSANFGPDHLLAAPSYSEKRKFSEKFNRVQGTYCAPNFPYAIAGNLYDANGFWNGHIQNNFAFAFQQTNFPEYACDPLHGYAADQYLEEDLGNVIPEELGLPCVLSVSQAQRLAKIHLLRNRYQGTGKMRMRLCGYVLQPNDTFTMSFPQLGWSEKLFEVTSTSLTFDVDNGAPQWMWVTEFAETDPSVYAWNEGEELTVYDRPANPTAQAPYLIAPPTNLTVTSSAATAIISADGIATPRIQLTWNTPEDIRVIQIAIQYRQTGTATWISAGSVPVSANLAFVGPVVSGLTYDVQIQSVTATGATSVWVSPAEPITTGAVLSSTSGAYAIGQNSLQGIANSDGTASIRCSPFTTNLAGFSVSYFPGGAVLLNGLLQQTYYDVFVVDPDLLGGNLTPVATTDKADYQGKFGYRWIGGLTTPASSSGSPGGSTGPTPVSIAITPNTPQQNLTGSTVFITGSLLTNGSSVGNIAVLIGPSSTSLPVTAWKNQATATVDNGDAAFCVVVPIDWWFQVVTGGAVEATVDNSYAIPIS